MIGTKEKHNVSNNVNLILNTYRCLFFQTATENVQCCSTALFVSMEIGRFWNLQHPKFVNLNGAKMVEVWNVNKLTKAGTKMEAGKLWTKAAK